MVSEAPAARDGALRRSTGAAAQPWIAPLAVTLAAVAFLWLLFGRPLVDYDIGWALIWGRELVHGSLPSYGIPGASTPHPLATLVAALASPLGTDGAYTAMLLVAYAGYGALVWGVFRLGETCFSWPVGLAAALVIAISRPVLFATSSGFMDVPAAALVVAAAVLEARTPRRGLPVLVLLGVAGLQRPEFWLLSAAYWLYLFPAGSWAARAKGAAVAAVAPLVWLLGDLAITGDLLHSFIGTRNDAGAGGAGVSGGLRVLLRLPVLAGALAGLGLGLLIDRARARVPVGLAIVGTAAIVLLEAAGLEVLARFLLVPAAGFSVLFGVGALGWTLRGPGRLRTLWAAGGAVLLLAAAVTGRTHVQSVKGLAQDREKRAVVVDDLRSLTRDAAPGSALRGCGQVVVPTRMLVPFAAYYLDRDATEIAGGGSATRRSAAFMRPVSPEARYLQQIVPFARPVPDAPSGFAPAGGNRSWRVYSRSC